MLISQFKLFRTTIVNVQLENLKEHPHKTPRVHICPILEELKHILPSRFHPNLRFEEIDKNLE